MGLWGGGGVMDLYDVTEELKKQCSFKLPSKKKAGKGRWNPHHGSKQFSVCVGNQVLYVLFVLSIFYSMVFIPV